MTGRLWATAAAVTLLAPLSPVAFLAALVIAVALRTVAVTR
jgi:hypothetical protein